VTLRHQVSLTHHGRALSVAPRNVPLETLAGQLARGQPAIAELEPGDATYYNLLIVPAWAPAVQGHLGRFGIPVALASDYLIVTRLTDTEGRAFYARADVEAWDLAGITHPWTRELLAWWLGILWQAIAVARGDQGGT